ncbi:MAG: Crp/Fnr family transcriptional regulator [Spirochaetaceae bacterium]|nr:MAG: Crp/Fnr family transcriptional regulator [Spirochaetaceae bacterium]
MTTSIVERSRRTGQPRRRPGLLLSVRQTGTPETGTPEPNGRPHNVCAGCFFGCAVSERAHRLIAGHRVVRAWEKGEYLFHAGDEAHGVWAICSGSVKVFKETEEGKQLTIRIALRGELVGHRSLLAGEALSGYGVAMEPIVTAYLPARVVMTLIETDSNVRTQIIHKLADELGHAETLATSMAYHPAEERLMAAIMELCRRSGDCLEPIDLVAPRLELAELAGLTVEATVRSLRRLEKASLVEAHGRRIRILNPRLLAARCGS